MHTPVVIDNNKFDYTLLKPTYYTLLKPMVYTMTSSIGAHISTHYTMLMPMVYTMTSSIGANTYTLRQHPHTDGIHDDEFDRGAYIHTIPCSYPLYTQ